MPKVVDVTLQRREICAAARKVFSRRGIEGTGLGHVARAAGMGRSSLYHYFSNKTSLVRALIREQLEEEQALFTSALRAAGSPLERIERLMAAQTSLFPQWAATTGLQLDLRSRHTRRFRPFFARIRGELAAVIREGQRRGEIRGGIDANGTAAILIGAVDGLLLQYFVDRKAFADLGALRDALLECTRKILTS